MTSKNEETISTTTQDWYKTYYKRKGADRNDLLVNPGVLYQHLANQEGFISTLRNAKNLNKQTSLILDVGCGGGDSLATLIHLGFTPEKLYGLDIIEERITGAKKKYPNLNFACDDASKMPYPSAMFDLTMESTMFVQITDDALSQKISNEMLRVTKPGGYILLMDWRYGKPGNKNYLAVSKKRILKLFSVNNQSDLICQKNGALPPPWAGHCPNICLQPIFLFERFFLFWQA